MTTAQASPNGHPSFPPPVSVENPADLHPADLPANQDHISQNQLAANHQTPPSAQEKVPAGAYHVPPSIYVPKVHAYRRDDHLDTPHLDGPLPRRCQFMFSDGRQCTMARSDIHPSLCVYHSEREEQLFGEPFCESHIRGRSYDLPELFSASGDLTTAAGVNRALGHVFRLFAQRRISRQEAATFGHLAKLLLRTISLMAAESESAEATGIAIQSSGDSPAANVYRPPRKGYPQDALFAVNEVELRGANVGAPLGRAKVYPQDELLRGNKDHQELS